MLLVNIGSVSTTKLTTFDVGTLLGTGTTCAISCLSLKVYQYTHVKFSQPAICIPEMLYSYSKLKNNYNYWSLKLILF